MPSITSIKIDGTLPGVLHRTKKSPPKRAEQRSREKEKRTPRRRKNATAV
jgi:hypothetical protein